MSLPKTSAVRPRQLALWTGFLAMAAALCALSLYPILFAWLFPQDNFEKIAVYTLPAGARVLKYKSHFCDSLLRSCHYWTLELPPDASLIGPPGATPDSQFDWPEGWRDEALRVLKPSTPAADVPECYRFDQRGREGHHYLFRHRNGTRCYYAIMTI